MGEVKKKHLITATNGDKQLNLIAQLFPFHFFLNEAYEIIQYGKAIPKLIPNITLGQAFDQFFTIKQPFFLKNIKEVQKFTQNIFVLDCQSDKTAQLKGQMLFLEDNQLLLFVGSPILKSPEMPKELGITLTDFALYDSLPDYLFALQAQNTSLKDARILAEKLKEQKQELMRSNEELKCFAYVASHDLKTPIRSIVSFSQLLATHCAKHLDALGEEYLSFIIGSGRRMQVLIDDLLTYSSTHHKSGVHKEIILNNLIDSVLADLSIQIQATKANITIPELPNIKADQQQLYQLFQNLFSNALKFHQTTIPPTIQLYFEEREHHYYFELSDNGIGIAPEYAVRIFKVFQRLHHVEEYEGTGVGLSICKKVVEKHGGEIWLKTDVEEGATFCFTIKKL